jgi:hypothetical protein
MNSFGEREFIKLFLRQNPAVEPPGFVVFFKVKQLLNERLSLRLFRIVLGSEENIIEPEHKSLLSVRIRADDLDR